MGVFWGFFKALFLDFLSYEWIGFDVKKGMQPMQPWRLRVLLFGSALVAAARFDERAADPAKLQWENGTVEAACADLAIAHKVELEAYVGLVAKLQSELAALRSVCGPRVAANQLELGPTTLLDAEVSDRAGMARALMQIAVAEAGILLSP